MVKNWPLHPLSTIFTFSLVYSHCSKAIAAAWLIQCFIFNYPPMFNGCIAVKLPHPQPSTCISTSFLNQPSTIVTCHQHQDAFAHIKGMLTHAHYACSFPSHAVVIHMDLLCQNTEALSLSIFACYTILMKGFLSHSQQLALILQPSLSLHHWIFIHTHSCLT